MTKDLHLLPTLILSKKFDRITLDKIKNDIAANGELVNYVHKHEGLHFGKTVSNRTHWDPDKNKDITDSILFNLPEEITKNILVDIAYHLQSFYPYDIHCDCGWLNLQHDECPYYLIIIPLESVNARTIILNQTSNGLHFVDYKNENKELPESEQISQEDFDTHLSHCWPQEKKYISVNKIFDWVEGDVLLCDIRRFHLSDNYRKNNLLEKNCITLMTKIKSENFLINLENISK